MSKRWGKVPSYRHHKARNLAVVTLDGKDFYLGKFDSPESRVRYEKLVAEWLLANQAEPVAKGDIAVCELISAYLQHAHVYYRKNGEVTREFGLIAEACRPLRRLFETTLAADFGPKALQRVRQEMVAAGLSRKFINKQIDRIRRLFKFAVSEELIPASVYQALATLPGLKKGRTDAPDCPPVDPVSEAHIEAALARLPATVADMLRIQRLTAARPGEICVIRPGDIDRSRDVWTFVPESHKTEHHGKRRIIYIGPRAQAILAAYLNRPSHAFCFSPHESERLRRLERHADRKTPANQGHRFTGERTGLRQPGERYSSSAYRKAIHRACDAAGIPRWSPNQIRHSAATEVRSAFGLDAAQVILGHSSASVTEIYAEVNRELGQKVAATLG